MNRISFSLLILMMLAGCRNPGSNYTVSSPDGSIQVILQSGKQLTYEVSYNGKQIIQPSAIALYLDHGNIIGRNETVMDTVTVVVTDTIFPAVKEKRAAIPDHYREMTMTLRDGFTLHFRVYNDGVAWRFAFSERKEITIVNEESVFRVKGDMDVYYPQVTQRNDADIFHTAFEENYSRKKVDSLPQELFAFTPVLLKNDGDPIVLITESDVLDYPGMFLIKNQKGGFKARFPGYPLKEKIAGSEFRQKIVTKRAPFICKTTGPRTFPWRVIAISPTDKDLPANDIVYRLASAPHFTDLSWIKPGKSTEEWTTGANLYGVDFKTGLNTATYKYYIDFASRFGFQYVMLDAGWSDVNDLFKITPGMDMEEITRYAKEKGIGLILWTQALTIERQMKEALEQFKKWDIKVVMTDFIDRNDQVAINFLHRFTKECADRQFMCMIHGAPVPAGFSRTWPNMVVREAVLGSEYNAWSARANPEHNLMLPFIRMVSGPMDYEPGMMQNATRAQTNKMGFEKVIAQGTLMHQMAMFVVYESPLQLFAGNLSDALREPELMTMLGKVPTVWDETRVVDAKLGDYIVEVRRNGNTWFVAAMNDWQPAEFKIPLDFLPAGNYHIQTAADGINASRNPQDYTMENRTVRPEDTITIELAPGGGYLGIISTD